MRFDEAYSGKCDLLRVIQFMRKANWLFMECRWIGRSVIAQGLGFRSGTDS